MTGRKEVSSVSPVKGKEKGRHAMRIKKKEEERRARMEERRILIG